MKSLSPNYFYGTVAAAATACVVTGAITYSGIFFSAPFVAKHGIVEDTLSLALVAAFVVGPISLVFGLIGGIAMLAIPFALTRQSGRPLQILAGILVGFAFDTIGIIDFSFASKSDFADSIPNIDVLTGLTGTWPAKLAAGVWAHGHFAVALVQFSGPIFAGILAGFVFSLCMDAKIKD